MMDENGPLPSDPWKRLTGFKQPCWDGLAYIAYAEEAGIMDTLGQDKFARRIIADEQTACRTVTREIILIPSEQHHKPAGGAGGKDRDLAVLSNCGSSNG